MTPTALLALDLDGTLLDAASQPAPDLLPELLSWAEGGAHLAVITARGTLTPLLGGWPLHSVSRCYGAWLQSGDTVRWSRTLPPPVIHGALAHLNRWELQPAHAKTVIVTEDPRHTLRSSAPDFAGSWRAPRGALKLVHGQPDAARLDDLQAQWTQLPDVTVIRERRDRLALVRGDGCKGAALRDLAAALNVPTSRVVAAGDGPADAAMRPHAGRFLQVGTHPALDGSRRRVDTPAELPWALACCRAELLGCPA